MRTTLVASLVVVWSQPALLKQWLFTWLICYFLLIFPLLFIQISIGYFITDLAMILWRFPALGGLEYVSWKILFFFSLGCCTYLYTFMMRWIQYPSYVIRKWQTNLFISFKVLHHGLSMFAMIQSLLSGQAQIYILMVLFTESTTPFVNLRW